MENKRRHKIIIIFISILLIISIITGTTILAIKYSKKTNTQNLNAISAIYEDDSTTKKDEKNNFFPKGLDYKKIYSQIRIKNGNPYFKKEVVSIIINEVIKKGSFVNGKLRYWFSFNEQKQILKIAFKWESSSGEKQEKTYNVKIII